MNTYKIYILSLAAAAPAVIEAYVQAPKYGPAWQAARALLGDGKPHKEHSAIKQLFSDAGCTTPMKPTFGDDYTVAKIVDIKPRNVKLDKTKLQDILNSKESTAEQKLEALKLQLAGSK